MELLMRRDGTPVQRALSRTWTVLLAMVFWLSIGAPSLADQAPADPNPLQPVDTSSPRATLAAFLAIPRRPTAPGGCARATRRWRPRARKALRALDLSQIGEALLQEVGVANALYLYETLNRIELPPPEAIPDADAVKAQGLKQWSILGTEITIAQVPDGVRAGEFLFTWTPWRFAPQFFAVVRHLPVRRGPER